MLPKRCLLICLTAVTFCFLGIQPAKACGDWDLIDCCSDEDDNLWLFCWDWLDCCNQWESVWHQASYDWTEIEFEVRAPFPPMFFTQASGDKVFVGRMDISVKPPDTAY